MTNQVAVYIPNWNGGERLLDVLDSLAAQTTPAQVVIVDNASTDGSAQAAKARHRDLAVVRLDVNRGFGGALGVGVRAHPAERLVFVNNDVVCKPRFLEAMLEATGSEPAMVAGVLLQSATPDLIDSAGVAADGTLLAWDYLHGEGADSALGAPPPLGPTGGAALYDRVIFEAAGGFDERIFAYLEDVDLALRLRLAGVPSRLAADARATHHHSSTLGSGSSAKNLLMGWSRAYMLRRYGILRQPRLAGRALFVEVVIALGQVVFDGNATGIRGRGEGWRAARGLPRRAFAPDGLTELTTLEALRRRSMRRTSYTKIVEWR